MKSMPDKKSSAASKNTKSKQVYLITGATSGLGVELIRQLINDSNQIRVIVKDDFLVNPEWKNLPSGVIPYISNMTFPSSKDSLSLEEACRNVDVVIHIAGASYNYKSGLNQLIDANVKVTENLLKTIIRVNKNKKVHFIFASSITVYGYKTKLQKITESSELHPGSSYSNTKMMAEQIIRSFSEVNQNIKYTILRYATFYGPHYEDPSFFKIFDLIKSQKMYYIGTSSNHLSFVHVDDAVGAIIAVLNNLDKAANQIYNVTDGQPYTPKYLFEKIAEILNVPPPKKVININMAKLLVKLFNINFDEFQFLTSDRIIDISKIKKDLGFVPKNRLDVQGLDMIKHYLSYKK
jgi:nucleoside-diphosphate-sugar epimerase